MSTRRRIRIGIDTGGTFTDFAFVRAGSIQAIKVTSNPRDPAAPILAGLARIGLRGPGIEVIHGTTVGTNALLERRGARTAILTTAGFEDLIEIGRQARPQLYALSGSRPAPLVPRGLRIGVRERILADGRVEIPLRAAEVREAFRRLARRGVESIAICLLHSHRNPEHEITAGRLAPRNLSVSLSHRVSPEYREFERFSTTVANAYLAPVLGPHLKGLGRALGRATLRVMTSNGGSAPAGKAAAEAVRTVLSGPAGGVLAAAGLGRRAGIDRLIAFDMGGTSTDVSLLDGGVRHSTEARLSGLPLRVPMIDIETVGAGGGSIARVDRGGALRVGPESAGADPGPVCYGRGVEPTVTDAHLLLGRLAPADFLGGEMGLDADRTARCLERFARPFARPAEEVAEAILAVANAAMERAVRRVSVARGFDPGRFTLLCYGGAGGLHACDLAESLGIRSILVPVHPGAFAAIGMLLSDAVRDYSQTVLLDAAAAVPGALERVFHALERQARRDLLREGVPAGRIRCLRTADLRYAGQSYELNLPVSAPVRLGALREAFHRRHRRTFGYRREDRPVEIVNLRVRGIGLARKPAIARARLDSRRRLADPAGERTLRYRGERLRGAVYRREALRPGDRLRGPAVVTEYSATLFLAPGFHCQVDPFGNLRVER
ncbi:MAG: hydantoinase/oxoprolinase family protein [Acidobacteria bacterium]|nr:hydantoinase/oxoprolinase family protein [Acidobacteriota bacterium]